MRKLLLRPRGRPSLSLANVAVRSFVPRVRFLMRGAKGQMQLYKLFGCQPCQRQKLTPVFCQPFILKH